MCSSIDPTVHGHNRAGDQDAALSRQHSFGFAVNKCECGQVQ